MPPLAIRFGSKSAWGFFDPKGDDDTEFISISECGIGNKALLASFKQWRTIGSDLAQFLDVAEMLVPLEEVLAVHRDPRFAALKDFDFKVELPEQRLSGRRAAAILRHRYSNWDEMLRVGGRNVGGLLYPEQYDQVRRGVDRLMAATQRAG